MVGADLSLDMVHLALERASNLKRGTVGGLSLSLLLCEAKQVNSPQYIFKDYFIQVENEINPESMSKFGPFILVFLTAVAQLLISSRIVGKRSTQ